MVTNMIWGKGEGEDDLVCSNGQVGVHSLGWGGRDRKD